MSVPYTGDVILISQKCCPSASSLEPRIAAVPQLYSEWKFTLRLSQLSNVAVDRLLASQTQSNSETSEVVQSLTANDNYYIIKYLLFVAHKYVNKSQSSINDNMIGYSGVTHIT